MSVRAYRINKIEEEEEPSFNLWHDEKVVDWLEKNTSIYEQFNGELGIIEIEVADLEKMLKEVKGIDRDVRTKIKEDIKWTKAQKKECCEDYIQYDCY